MFDTWASYESTRAFCYEFVSLAAARERLPNSNTSSLATKQPPPHNTQAPTGSNDTIQQKARTAFYFNWADDALSLAILSTRPIRVRPTQSEHSGQRIDACERLSPPRSNSSQDDENHPISGRSPPRKGHPREKDVTIPNQGNRRRIPQPRPPRGRTARPVAGRLLEASPPTNKKRRSPEQPALSFLSFANAFLVSFAREAPAPPLAPSARASAYLGKPVHPGQETHLAREGRPRP